jgi:uncharacterized protein YbcI
METARPALETLVEGITGSKVVSLHHDVSTVTGEEVALFTLDTPPVFREAKRGRISGPASSVAADLTN